MNVAMTRTRTMDALACKAKFFHVLDEVASSRCEVVVRRNGHPVAKIVPIVQKPRTLYGAMKGSIKSVGDLDGPDGENWEVLKE
ncbi:MAG: type II toxin-antitoxin system Phd/YefM family antitoxin [Reyranella sp.]|nr:type II toxin-antitoxin system Phd/YefM family antitoxin [Reyranella sp.]